MLGQRLSIRSRVDFSAEEAMKRFFRNKGLLADLRLSRLFWLLEKEPGAFQKYGLQEKIPRVFFDPVVEELQTGFPSFHMDRIYAEIRFLPGVTDNWARSATEALQLLGDGASTSWQDFPISVHSGWQLEVSGDLMKQMVEKELYHTLANPLLHKVSVYRGDELIELNRLGSYPEYWRTRQRHRPELRLFDLNFEILSGVNEERGLALSEGEIHSLIAHFSSPDQLASRKAQGWDHKITEVELECFAQTWSEHCKHKIFAAEVSYTEEPGTAPALGNKTVKSLYKTYIQGVTKELDSCGYLVSVFKDNAGIVDFDKNINVCVKVETHNSPSALDPFGGALTGILGVNRDILGTGIGAKPVANMDVFCLSEKRFFPEADSPQRPELLKDPSVIFRGVHQGVEEGGNQSGIPTVNGAFHFAGEFSGKPLIFVGSLGVLPKEVAGRKTESKRISPGDKIVVAGGRLGKDGVHGATFSSLELKDQVAPNVVQIGDSITQKRLLDFTLQARDRGLIQALTDNGAGGVSSSIGEMAQISGGARLDLSRHPVKYPGLEYWEMLVSESQERMSYAVAPEMLSEFLDLASSCGVEAFCMGEFTQSGLFEVEFDGLPLARIDLHFLHEGLEKMKLQAHFQGPQVPREYYRQQAKKNPRDFSPLNILKTVLSSPNVASREPLVRCYDHEVQGATRVKPYGGRTQQGPSDAGVIDLEMHGGEKGNALAVANGLCPQFSSYDTYLMAQKAVDEAVRNLVATGVDPQKMALVDNFCWPDPLPKSSNPEALHKMAQLVRACEGLYEAAKVFKAPLVSGKDSMKNDFIGRTQGGEIVKISVPPTLLITAIGQIPQAERVLGSSFQKEGDKIYVLGDITESLWGSVYAHEFDCALQNPEYPFLEKNYELYQLIYSANKQGLLRSCHDVSDGGLLSAVAESCFGEWLGVQLVTALKDEQLWSETGSQFVVTVAPENEAYFKKQFGCWATELGRVTAEPFFVLNGEKESIENLHAGWVKGVLNVYQS